MFSDSDNGRVAVCTAFGNAVRFVAALVGAVELAPAAIAVMPSRSAWLALLAAAAFADAASFPIKPARAFHFEAYCRKLNAPTEKGGAEVDDNSQVGFDCEDTFRLSTI